MRIIGKQRSDTVTATEIACWVYCPEQWRLQHGLGLEPANRKELAAGTRHHSRKAAAERVAGGAIALGRVLSTVRASGDSGRRHRATSAPMEMMVHEASSGQPHRVRSVQ
jgi:hypothetical protein